jgi:hypothetical protein
MEIKINPETINTDKEKPIAEQEEKKARDITADVPHFNMVEYELNGKRYTMDVSPLLSITNEGLEAASDLEIDTHLEKIAAYRHSIATLKESIGNEHIRAQEKFEKWQSKNWNEAVKIALLSRKELKDETGAQGGWFGSVTKEEIKGIMMTKFESEYDLLNDALIKYKTMDKVIGNLLKILEDRGSQVQTIIRRRQGLRREV